MGLSMEAEVGTLFTAAERATGWLFGTLEAEASPSVRPQAASFVEAKPLTRAQKPRIRLGDPLPRATPAPRVEPEAQEEREEEAGDEVLGPRLSRQQVVERILLLNPTVNEAFLEQFDRASLDAYLRRLTSLEEPRGHSACWVRTGETPAILGRERPD